MPKKAKGKKKDAGTEEEKSDYEIQLEAKPRSELEDLIVELTSKLKELTAKRNYFQLERDTIDGFRTMTSMNVERLTSASKMRDLELGELMEQHRCVLCPLPEILILL